MLSFPKSSKCVHLGFNSVHKGYLCLNSNGRIYIAAHVNFNKDSFPFQTDPSFMVLKLVHPAESINTLRKFITVSFLPKSQDHETTEANTRTSEDINRLDTPSGDQTPNKHS